MHFSLSADSFVSFLHSGRGALFAQSGATDARSSAAVFMWDATVKVISRSSTSVIGISSEPCCPHFVAPCSAGRTEELSGELTAQLHVSGIKRKQNLTE